jgi:hypothetical protein
MAQTRTATNDFTKYQLRVGLDLILRYNGLGTSITRVLNHLTESCESHTVVHVHFNVPIEDMVLENAELHEMSGIVGLSDNDCNHAVLFRVRVLENHVTNCEDQPLRRIDIHYDKVSSARKKNECLT